MPFKFMCKSVGAGLDCSLQEMQGDKGKIALLCGLGRVACEVLK